MRAAAIEALAKEVERLNTLLRAGAPRLMVIIENGQVTGVRSSDPRVTVDILNMDDHPDFDPKGSTLRGYPFEIDEG